MNNISINTLESLISTSSKEDSFYILASTIQSLYNFLQNNCSLKTKNDYLKLMAYFLENYLDKPKLMFLRQYLEKTIINRIQKDCTKKYFKQRLNNTELFELLKHYNKLTGNYIVLSHINYSKKKFKIKQLKIKQL